MENSRNRKIISKIYINILKKNRKVEIKKIKDNMFEVFVVKRVIEYSFKSKSGEIYTKDLSSDAKDFNFILDRIDRGDLTLVSDYKQKFRLGILTAEA